MSEPMGLLLAMMQPSPEMEEEFHDWYDTEHIVQRSAIDGFLSAQRFVCLDGFPRYVACYDLREYGVLKEPGYMKLAGTNFSPWSKRMLSRVHGQGRVEGPQIYPGYARYGDAGAPGRMGLVRLRGLSRDAEPGVVDGLRAIFDHRPDVLQLRIFRSDYEHDFAYVALIDALVTFRFDTIDLSPLGDLLRHVDLLNLYAPYWRRGYLAGVTT